MAKRAIFAGHVLARISILPKISRFWLWFPVFILNEGNDRLTNNMQTLYVIDQSWCVRRWDLQRTVKAMQICVHISVGLEAALSIPIGV